MRHSTLYDCLIQLVIRNFRLRDVQEV
jgi:hypothetical protein